MTLDTKLLQLNEVKLGIKQAIEDKGVSTGDSPFTHYPDLVRQITSGGGLSNLNIYVVEGEYYPKVEHTIPYRIGEAVFRGPNILSSNSTEIHNYRFGYMEPFPDLNVIFSGDGNWNIYDIGYLLTYDETTHMATMLSVWQNPKHYVSPDIVINMNIQAGSFSMGPNTVTGFATSGVFPQAFGVLNDFSVTDVGSNDLSGIFDILSLLSNPMGGMQMGILTFDSPLIFKEIIDVKINGVSKPLIPPMMTPDNSEAYLKDMVFMVLDNDFSGFAGDGVYNIEIHLRGFSGAPE